ncbi:testis-expressed protein 15 [Dendropsophus ebraccatus]|uniref:testis-expressed protein 15 n=1 Tax=Dendropsophus ebraccatus TaxID=150705 RepID=UPI0038319004
MEDQVKTSFGAKHVENKLQNFTIPKIKRNVDKCCLLRCTPNRREFGEILDILNKGRLNLTTELKSSWTFSEIKLVINDQLTEFFFEKRNEMKEQGRHGRELEDRFCFLVVPNQTAADIADHGLSVGSTATKVLGNPEMGVYLFRHIDVALNFAHQKKLSLNMILIFKVLFGKVNKVKTIPPGSALKSVLDPTPNFDSHVSKKAPLWTDAFDEQVTNSLIYVYEYDSNLKPVRTPRQCLPIAAVDVNIIVNKIVTAPVQVRLPSKHVSPGNTTLANCTVAKRIGKGKDAMVIYKSVRPPLVQTCGLEVAQSNVSDKESPSIPDIETEQSCGVFAKSPLLPNNIALPDLSISLQQHNVALENVITSCMVITSKSIKDPRLLKRSDQQTSKPVGQENQCSVCFENELSSNFENNTSNGNVWNLDGSINKTPLYLSFEERRVYDSFVMTDLFVKELKKYSSFLTCNENETNLVTESLPIRFCEKEMDLSDKDHLYGVSLDELGTEESPEAELAVSMSLSTLNCNKETREYCGKSKDSKCMSQNQNPKNKDTAESSYLSLHGKEKEPQILSLPHIPYMEKSKLPKKQCSNDKIQLDTAKSQQTHVSDFLALDNTKVTSEKEQKSSKDYKCLSQNFNPRNRDTARALDLAKNGKERHLGLELLQKTEREGKLKFSNTMCRDDNYYRICTSQLGTKESLQINVSDSMSLDYSKEISENGGKSEDDRHVTQKTKMKAAAGATFSSFKGKNKESKTQASESVSLNTLSYTSQTDENQGKPKTNKHISKKTHPQNKATTSSLFERKEKDKMLKSSLNESSTSPDTLSNIKVTIKNRGKSEGRRSISQHAILKNKITARTSSLFDYYKEHCLNSKKHSRKHSSSATNKTKLIKKSKECVISLKRRSCSPDRVYKAVKNHQKASDEINSAHDQKPTSIGDSLSPRKLFPTAGPHEKVKCQETSEKGAKKQRCEFSVPKGVTGKIEECKNITNGTPKLITLDISEDVYTFDSLSVGSETKTANENDRFVLYSPNKINKGTIRKEKSIHPSQTHPVCISPIKTGTACTDIEESVKDVEKDKPLQASQSKKMRNQALAFPKSTSEDVLIEDSCFVTELEKRIDWNGIFGMELEKVNAMLATLQNTPLRRVKEPSGLRIFPDMEINITNNHYLCADSYSNNKVEEIQSSKVSNTFEDFNNVTQDHQITDSVPGIQVAIGSPDLQSVKNTFKVSLDPLPMDNSIQSGETSISSNPNPSEKPLPRVDPPIMKKRLNRKKVPSVLIKRSTRRIHKFSQSEENIKVVLGMLSDEIPFCKNKRISKKIDRAILHLRKAHKRVKKSLQLVAKARERQHLAESCSVQDTHSISGKEVNAKQVESTSSHILQTQDSSPNSKTGEVQNSLTTDKKCLTESTQVMINRASVQDSQQAKINGSSATKMSLLIPYKVTKTSPETPEVNSNFTSVIVSDKENAVPVVPSMKSPSNDKEKQAVNETTGKDCLTCDDGQKRRHASKQMFSETRKRSSSLIKSLSKCSGKKSHTVNEKNRLKGRRIKEFQYMSTKSTTSSGLLLKKLSDILQKASETDSLQALQNCKLMCQKMIPAFINAFEKKQQCAFKDVIVDRRMFVKKNLRTCFKCTLKPEAVEAFLELQMIIETREFVENRMNYIEGRPTFRSLLWYDRSLYKELFTGECGYQQQSNIYSAFQEKLKLNSLTTLEKHYTHLSEFLQDINERDSCYYVYLKYRRELRECEDVVKHHYDHAAFSLSVPFSCGVHLGDTMDDLTALQNSTLEIIKTFVTRPKCNQGKKEHAVSLLEVICAKIEHIKTSVSTSMHISLFGIEHLLFDAAKVMAFNERKKRSVQRTITKELMGQINSIALSKLYEIYCAQCEPPVDAKMNSSNEALKVHKSLELFGNQKMFFFGKIIDQALCAEPSVLEKMIQVCNQHLEFQTKCFQILQECIVDEVIIQETNVVDMAERQDKYTTLLKPEAVEAYIDLAMTYETLHFLNCLVASKNGQVRTRGLLWYDTSLFSDLICNQYRVQSILPEDTMPSAMDIIETTISEIKTELEIISSCSNSVNYTYAFQIMTRELSELSELKNFLKSSPVITTYINFSPFVVSLHYGNSLTELDHNYNQLSGYLGALMSTPKKDLGKSAHTMKILKTIEFTKALVFKPGLSPFDFIACNVQHNSKKNRQASISQSKEEQILHSHSPRKRICANISPEDSSFPSCKKQKVTPSPGKTSVKERENQVMAELRQRKQFEMHTTVAQLKDQHAVKKDCLKGSPQRESKLCVSTSPKQRTENNGKNITTSPSDHDKVKKVLSRLKEEDSSARKCQEASATTDKRELTLDLKVQPQADNIESWSDSCYPEPVTSLGSDHENASKQLDLQNSNTIEEFSEEKDPSLDDNVSILSVCSMDTTTSEEKENMKQMDPATGEQEQLKKDLKPFGTEELQKGQSAMWNSKSVSKASGQYPQFPVSANPWQYSSYSWYQNGNNAGRVTQGYPHLSYSTQSTNPYQASAFGVPNSYIANQPYSGFSGQIQAQIYSIAGPFNANFPYNYTDPSSSSNQNPMPYCYNSTAGWPWGSWQ